MSDASKTSELLAEARETCSGKHFNATYEADLIRRLADALEATLGEPDGDGELIEYALDYIENGTMRPERREALRALAARATVPDAMTELRAERDAALAEIESRIEDRDYWYGIANMAKSQRDAATAAVERVRAIHVRTAFDDSAFDGSPDDFYCKPCQTTAGIWPCATFQALDGAPEPEWEERIAACEQHGTHCWSCARITERRRPAGPWLLVEGESKP